MRPKPENCQYLIIVLEIYMHTSKHGSACPSTNAQLVHALESGKAVIGVNTRLASLVELISKDVQHELTVALGVDVSVRLVIKTFSERGRVDEVAIVRHADSVRTIHVERLCLCMGAAAGGRVSQVTKAHEARKI